MLWLLPLALCVILIIRLFRQRPRIHRNGKKLGKPNDTLPLLGNSIRFMQPRHKLFDWFVKQQMHFGSESYEISVPTIPQGVVINSAENVDFVLKHENTITKGEFFRTRSWDLFGYGIINASGDLWRTQRKAGLKFFTGNNLDVLVEEVLPEVFAETRQNLRKAVAEKTTIDMQKVFLDLTTTVMGHMAYDMDISASSPFSKAFDYASDRVALRFQNPLYRITEVFTGARFWAALQEVQRFGKEIVKDARKRRSRVAFDSLVNDQEVVFGTLIDSLLDSFNNLQIVADAALNFLSAGRDTTAQSMTWTLYALLRDHNARNEMLASVVSTFRDPGSEAPTETTTSNSKESGGKDDLTSIDETSTQSNATNLTLADFQPSVMPLLYATMYESLRFYPPVPIEIKQTLQPITLPDGTFLPADAIIIWCIWSLNRSQEIYGVDADTFRPNRWLDPTTGKFIPKSTGEFAVFNGGPRACLGKKMAEIMLAYVIGRLLVEFEFEEVGKKDDKLGHAGTEKVVKLEERVSQNSLTLPMLGGLPCRVTLRK